MMYVNIMTYLVPVFWIQGDMGPVGEMGSPGLNGLKVIAEAQTLHV